jgi:hypothetical protein
MSVDPFQELMNVASDPAFRDRIGEIRSEVELDLEDQVTAEVYLACFSTPAGRAVLADLYNRYANVSRWVPGEPEFSGYYREGMAQVVYDIAEKVEVAAQGDLDDGNES